MAGIGGAELCYECRKGSSSKFWAVRRRGGRVVIRFGRIGGKKRVIEKHFARPIDAEEFVDKLVREKQRKGYRDVPAESTIVRRKDPPGPRKTPRSDPPGTEETLPTAKIGDADRLLECRKGSSSKYWTVRRRGTQVVIRFGLIGGKERVIERRFARPIDAEEFVDKRMEERFRTGYLDVSPAKAIPGGEEDPPESWRSPRFDWMKARERGWEEWVPSMGQAKTVQGEVLRCTGKLTREAYNDGNGNWDRDCTFMWRFVAKVLADPKTFPRDVCEKIRKTAREIIRDRNIPDLSGHGSTYYYLMEMAARWCAANPLPRPHRPDPKLQR